MIFVTVGTERFPFDRLVRSVDQAAEQLKGERVFMQLGAGQYLPRHCSWKRFLSFEEMLDCIREARLVVAHAGAGTILTCLKEGKKPLVMPRRCNQREHVDDHQLTLSRRMAELGYVWLAENSEEISSFMLRGKQGESWGKQSAFPSTLSQLIDAVKKCLYQQAH